MYQVTQSRDRAQWDAALAALPSPHVLQTWDWGEFKGRWGWHPTRLLFERDGQTMAVAQVLHRRLSRTPFTLTYVPKGPILDYADRPLLTVVLSTLEEEARQRHSLFVKIDPDVPLGVGTNDTPPQPAATAVQAALAGRGWRRSREQIQFKNTVLVDLVPDEEALLAGMKSKTRYNVRLAGRRGVKIRPGDASNLDAFYDLYHETAQRDGFLIRPFAYYQDVWTQFLTMGRAHLLLAEINGESIAGLILFVFAQTAWYMYGASSAAHRNLMPNYLLQWEAMRLAKHLGCTCYDMWGAPDRFDPGDSMWGVYRFKTGFGGETVRGMGAYDCPMHPWRYRAYTTLMPRVLSLMRRRHRPGL